MRPIATILGGTLVLVATLALSGCGGGDDDQAPAATSGVPASASASVGGFIGYLQALVVSRTEALDPVDVSAVVAPVSDTTDPGALN